MAVTLVAALAAWATSLGGDGWLPVLAPFAPVLLVPVAMLARLRAGGTDALPGTPASTRQQAVTRCEPREVGLLVHGVTAHAASSRRHPAGNPCWQSSPSA